MRGKESKENLSMQKIYRFATKKLVRHKTPALLAAQEITIYEQVLNDKEFIEQLKNKLIEETAEVAEAHDRKELTEELADVLEVIYTLAKASNVSLEEVEKIRLEKRETSGHFEHKLFSMYMDIKESSPRLEYFRKKSHKYPEIIIKK